MMYHSYDVVTQCPVIGPNIYYNLMDNVFNSWYDLLRILEKLLNNFPEIIGVVVIVRNFMTRSSEGLIDADVWNAGTGVGLIINYALIYDS